VSASNTKEEKNKQNMLEEERKRGEKSKNPLIHMKTNKANTVKAHAE
jgi:hypothetical protein